MEPTHPDTFDGYLVTLGDGVLEVHKCATLWTALPATLFGRPVPPKLRIVNRTPRGRREVALQSVTDVEVREAEGSKGASSYPWVTQLLAASGEVIGPALRFREERSAQDLAGELRRQIAELKR
jgi:hypothetical protein